MRQLLQALRPPWRGRPEGKVFRVPEGVRVYAFGDVHGRADLLEPLLAAIAREAGEWSRCEVVGLGDYLDRGPDPKRVVDLLVAAAACKDWRFTALRGNHEDAFLDALADPGAMAPWLEFGGAATLVSYGIPPIAGVPSPDRLAHMRAELAKALPPAHLALIRAMPDSLRLGDYYFVHAGVRPGRALDCQDPLDLLWIRQDFLASRRFHGAMVVHGHHIVERPEILPNRIGVDTGAYCTGVLTCLVLEGGASWFLQATPEGVRRISLPPG